MGMSKKKSRKLVVGVNDLVTVNPELVAEWHPTKNGDLTPEMFTAGSVTKVWWQCVLGHEWQSSINNRNRGKGCPYCANKEILPGYNDLATTNSELTAEWHPTKNGDLTPDMVFAGGREKAWWKCKEGHEWQAPIDRRNRGAGCPYCTNKKVLPGYNDLATKNSKLAAEWHPTKNGELMPQMVVAGSNRKVWWLCSACGHEWQNVVQRRNNGAKCPQCKAKKKAENKKIA